MASTLNRLLSPGTIGCLKLRNRIVLPPMVRSYATPDGMVTRKMVDHYAARAKGGVGMVMIEATSVHPSGKGWHQGVVIDHDKYIPGLNDLTEAVKSWGSRIAVQLHHAGRQTSSVITGMPIVAPSTVPCRVMGGLPRELTTAEVGELVEAFAQAARRAKAAGFDAVEVHGAHGYLVGQFFSPNTNRRTDKYGGDVNGRTTFAVEIIRRTRELVGPNFPIIVRMNATDLVAGGLELDESQQIARILQAAGADALNISVGTYEARLNPDNGSAMGIAAMYVPRGHLVAYAAQIKSQVKIPVITVGSITPAMGEEILKQGKADFIAMGRQLLADPELPNKLMRNDPASIRPCIRCNEFCSGKVPTGVRCSVNAEVGFESYGLKPVFKQKKVLIVGGGPAAMEAARVAAIRGHKVVLYEKNSQLGGHLVEGTVP
ncbi:MAG: FAD-dependent oxidoreductase, partial [Dehalococcoidales bacterium]|nr:FAD-dependent oxidoreductase [Dehalococcoidales bacterium]